jgi:hypothetical protein
MGNCTSLVQENVFGIEGSKDERRGGTTRHGADDCELVDVQQGARSVVESCVEVRTWRWLCHSNVVMFRRCFVGEGAVTPAAMTREMRGRMLDMVECEWFGGDASG